MRADLVLLLLALPLLAPVPALAAGATVLHTGLLNVAQGVLQQGETDRYPDLLGGGCAFPAVGVSQLYVTVEGAQPGDVVVLWTLEEDAYQRWVWVEHPAEGTPPVAQARTFAPYFTCPAFRVEGRSVEAVVGYTVVACHLAGACPDRLPGLGG